MMIKHAGTIAALTLATVTIAAPSAALAKHHPNRCPPGQDVAEYCEDGGSGGDQGRPSDSDRRGRGGHGDHRKTKRHAGD